MKIIKITAKEMEKAGYCGPNGGAISGSHYALYEEEKGFVLSMENPLIF